MQACEHIQRLLLCTVSKDPANKVHGKFRSKNGSLLTDNMVNIPTSNKNYLGVYKLAEKGRFMVHQKKKETFKD